MARVVWYRVNPLITTPAEAAAVSAPQIVEVGPAQTWAVALDGQHPGVERLDQPLGSALGKLGRALDEQQVLALGGLPADFCRLLQHVRLGLAARQREGVRRGRLRQQRRVVGVVGRGIALTGERLDRGRSPAAPGQLVGQDGAHGSLAGPGLPRCDVEDGHCYETARIIAERAGGRGRPRRRKPSALRLRERDDSR